MSQIMDHSLTVIIPAYNEEKSLIQYLPDVVEFCEKNDYKLIVVNDGSKDSTAKVVSNHIGENNLSLVNHKVNKGYGAAIKSGIKAANTRFLITIDADGQHYLEDIKKLHLKMIESDADLIIGSREGQRSASMYRGIGKKLIYFIAKMLIKFDIKDLNSGMKIYDTALAKKYIYLCPDSMPYSDIISLVFISNRHLVMEEPIRIKNRISGESTIGTMTAIETVKEILNIVVLFNPFKIFFFAAIMIFVVSCAWGFPLLLKGNGISGATLLGILTSILVFLIGLVAEQISQIRRSIFIISENENTKFGEKA